MNFSLGHNCFAFSLINGALFIVPVPAKLHRTISFFVSVFHVENKRESETTLFFDFRWSDECIVLRTSQTVPGPAASDLCNFAAHLLACRLEEELLCGCRMGLIDPRPSSDGR